MANSGRASGLHRVRIQAFEAVAGVALEAMFAAFVGTAAAHESGI